MNKLFIICGHSFAGKSTLAKAIVERYGYEEVDVDVTKTHLYGLDVQDEDLSPSEWERIYAETDNLIVKHLQAGKTVLDASRNFAKIERQHIREVAAMLDVEIVTIYVDTPEDVARQRLLANRKNKTRVDWSDAQFDELVKAMEPPGPEENPLTFHYENAIETWVTKHIDIGSALTDEIAPNSLNRPNKSMA